MRPVWVAFTTLTLLCLQCAAHEPAAGDLAASLSRISIDPEQSYRIRDLQFRRGDIKIYLNDGVLAFATPVAGHTVAAIFLAEASEAGDAEVLVVPPRRSERASLASFTKSPNLDEHFNSAVFLFSDDTARELLSSIGQAPIRKAEAVAAQNASVMNAVLRGAAAEIGIRLVEALLDTHPPEEGFFYAFLNGRELGNFDIFYDPAAPEPVAVGRTAGSGGRQAFQLWTEFRPRNAARSAERFPVLKDYRIDATIRPDLTLAAVADFTCLVDGRGGRVLGLGLSEHLRVKSATVDGKTVEVYQPETLHSTEQQRGWSFLLIAEAPLDPGSSHNVEVRYEGSVIRGTGHGAYFVDERNAWYPQRPPMWTNFDLTFRFTPQLTLVSTGELVSDEVAGGMRVVHRKTRVPAGLAGFNVGDYERSVEERGAYRVESYADQGSAESLETVAQKTGAILDYYTKQWTPLPIHSIAVTPIAGTFGQGFPGLIYLSTMAYMRAEDRPTPLRTERLDTFFSEMLLAHEVAHQWWGNIVIPADYRSGWLVEAMANYSALQVLESTHGSKAVEVVLDTYRADLMQQQNGRRVDSFGPVDFGVRLADTAGVPVWHKIVYEKGTWVLHMLRLRMGDEGFRNMQLQLLREFAAKPFSNEDLRRVASEFIPAGQPDRDLTLFFDSWVYATGIPQLSIAQTAEGEAVVMSGVDEDFTVDVPVRCRAKPGAEQMRWVRVSPGSNAVDPERDPGSCGLPPFSAYLYLH